MTRLRALLPAVMATAALTSPALAAQTSGPNAEVIAAVDAAMQAGMKGDIPAMAAQYAPGCTFADEFAPFFWSGSGSLQAYLMAGGRMNQETRHKDDKAVFAPASYVYVADDRAFVVEKVSGAASVRGRPYAEQGAFAFTLARTNGRWMIISQTWTKSGETFDPYKDETGGER